MMVRYEYTQIVHTACNEPYVQWYNDNGVSGKKVIRGLHHYHGLCVLSKPLGTVQPFVSTPFISCTSTSYGSVQVVTYRNNL